MSNRVLRDAYVEHGRCRWQPRPFDEFSRSRARVHDGPAITSRARRNQPMRQRGRHLAVHGLGSDPWGR